MYSWLRRNSPRAQQRNPNSFTEPCTVSWVFLPGTLFSCVAVLVVMATAFSLTHADPAGAVASSRDVLIVTASISSCVASQTHSQNLGLLESQQGAATASVNAILNADCSYSLVYGGSSSSNSSGKNSAAHTVQQQQQRRQPPAQVLQVAGLDPLTCIVHNKLLPAQRYVFMLSREDASSDYHIVEYAPLSASTTDSQAVLSGLMSGWEPIRSSQLAWQPLGCYTSSNLIRTGPGSSSSTGGMAPSQPSTRTHTPAGAVNPGTLAVAAAGSADAVPAATTPQRRLLQGTDAASPSPSPAGPVGSQSPSPSPADQPVPSPSPSPLGEQSPSPSPAVQPVPSPSPPPSPIPTPEPTDNTTTSGTPDAGANSTATLNPNVTANAGPQEASQVRLVNVTSGRLVQGVNATLEVVQMVCKLPTATGPCRASIKRWAYDATRGACRNFTYGGCQGNQNNFEIKDLCEQVCLPAMTNTTANMTNTTEPAPPPPPSPPFVPVSYKAEQLPDLVVTEHGVDYASPPQSSNADAYGVAVSMLVVVFVVLIEFLVVY